MAPLCADLKELPGPDTLRARMNSIALEHGMMGGVTEEVVSAMMFATEVSKKKKNKSLLDCVRKEVTDERVAELCQVCDCQCGEQATRESIDWAAYADGHSGVARVGHSADHRGRGTGHAPARRRREWQLALVCEHAEQLSTDARRLDRVTGFGLLFLGAALCLGGEPAERGETDGALDGQRGRGNGR